MTRVSVAVLALLASAQLFAQDQLTTINVAAIDRQGAPVPGLKSTDFQVQEDGKTRPIAFFRFTGAATPEGKPETGEYSNRTAAPPQATVILMDLLSDRMMTGAIISDQLLRAVKGLESSDGLYLYFLTSGGELYPIHPLPKPDALVPTATSTTPWTQNLAPLLQTALKNLVGIKPVDDRDSKVRFDLTMRAMRELGSDMQLVGGRKNLIWVTRGLPLNGPSISAQGIVDFTQPLHIMCEQFQRAQIAVYPVGSVLGSQDSQTLEEMANLTGGRKYGWGEVGQAIKESSADTRGDYEIVFEPAGEKPDGKHRKLKVTCTHKDVRLQTVAGFYNLLAPVKPEDMVQLGLQLAMRSPFDATAIGVSAFTTPDPATPGNTRFEIRIDPKDLMFEDIQGKQSGKILIQFGFFGEKGLEQPQDPMAMAINMTPDQYQAATKNGIVLRRSVKLNDTVQKVRVVVVDGELGSAGSVLVPVQ